MSSGVEAKYELYNVGPVTCQRLAVVYRMDEFASLESMGRQAVNIRRKRLGPFFFSFDRFSFSDKGVPDLEGALLGALLEDLLGALLGA